MKTVVIITLVISILLICMISLYWSMVTFLELKEGQITRTTTTEWMNVRIQNRTKRSLGVGTDSKKEYELQTRKGDMLKITRTRGFNDGAIATFLPTLIDTVTKNEIKILNAVRAREDKNLHQRFKRQEPNENTVDPDFGRVGLRASLLEMKNLFLKFLGEKNSAAYKTIEVTIKPTKADLEAAEKFGRVQRNLLEKASRFLVKQTLNKEIGSPCCPDSSCCPDKYM